MEKLNRRGAEENCSAASSRPREMPFLVDCGRRTAGEIDRDTWPCLKNMRCIIHECIFISSRARLFSRSKYLVDRMKCRCFRVPGLLPVSNRFPFASAKSIWMRLFHVLASLILYYGPETGWRTLYIHQCGGGWLRQRELCKSLPPFRTWKPSEPLA